MFLIDTSQGRIIDDEEIKSDLAAAHPYGEWLAKGVKRLEDLPHTAHITESRTEVLRDQQTFGYTIEELKVLIEPMARNGAEALGSMGTDTPLAVLSERPKLLYDYFKQLFAQVTNPPLDAIREELVTSLGRNIGPEANILDPGPESCQLLELPYPIIDNDSLERILHVEEVDDRFRCTQDPVSLPGVLRRARTASRPRTTAHRGLRGDRRGREHHRAVRRHVHRGPGADSDAPGHLRGAPPPDP